MEVDPNDPEYIIVSHIGQVDLKGSMPHWLVNQLGGGYLDEFKRHHKKLGDIIGKI